MMYKLSNILIVIFLIIGLSHPTTLQAYNTESGSYFTVTISNNPSPGYLIMGALENPYLAIYDNCGNIVVRKSFNVLSEGYADFKLHPNGKFSAYDFQSGKFLILDSNLNVIDTIGAVGYPTDWHDFLILPNGNYLVIGETTEIIDMSRLIPGGYSSAIVYSFILQEINHINKNVVWSWNALDHFSVLDATEDVELTSHSFNPFHPNSMTLAPDGNLVISCRHLDELTKINRSTGQILWRMGGSKCRNNQFTFMGDTVDNFFGFSHQHDPVFLSNGNLLLFDNGNLKNPHYSRAVEYELDETNRRVRKVWEYRHTGNEVNPEGLFVPAMGSVQRLPNGNTLIGWGGTQGSIGNIIVLTEVRPDGSIALEVQGNIGSYRVQRINYRSNPVTLDISNTGTFSFVNQQYNTNVSLNITSLNGSGTITVEKHQFEPSNITESGPCVRLTNRWTISKIGINYISGQISFSLSGLTNNSNPQNLKIYYRPSECSGNFNELATTYSSETSSLIANFAGFGEYCIGMNSVTIPTLLLPSKEAINQNLPVRLVWRRYMPNETYRLQISTDKDFINIIYENPNIKDTFALLSRLDYGSNYYWRLRSESDQCISGWSEVRKFTTVYEPIVLNYPENLSINQPLSIRFIWSGNPKAQIYNLQLSDDFEFSNLILDTNIITAYLDFNNLEPYKDYYWRVRFRSGIYISAWSEVWTFRTIYAPPKLSFPQNMSISIPISGELQWYPSPGAERYNLVVSKKQNFFPPTLEVPDLTSTYFHYDSLEYYTEYYWKVKTIGKDGKSEWSEVYKFRTQLSPPSLISPYNESNFAPIKGLLRWTQIDNSTGYELQISTDPNLKVNISTFYVPNTYFIYENLLYETNYYWRVRALEDSGYSPWSEIYTFRTVPENYLSVPILIYPPNQTKNVKLTENLSWVSTPNAKSYIVEIATDMLFINILVSKEQNDTLFPIRNLSYGTRYYWRVRAQNENKTSNWSEIFSFITAIREPQLISPLDNAENLVLPVEFIWERIGTNLLSKFQIAYDNEFNFIISENDLYDQNTIVYYNLPGETKLFWRVKVYNSSLESDWSKVNSLTISKINSVESGDNILYIYPNPFNEFLTIRLGENITGKCSIAIYDIFNRVVFEKNITNAERTFLLHPENMKTGTYILTIKTEDRTIVEKFLFLQ
ncbi:MAG: aryl-sulfate sulfotransferase [Candidatus Kapaibacteriales bacterium]